MTERGNGVEAESGGQATEPWYAHAYKWVATSSHRDDWHPEVYRNFDPEKWIETIASCGLDVLFYQSKSHSGNAYYQTELDHSHLGLKGRDAMGEMLELCHQRGIRFVVNQSMLFDNYLFKTQPDWRIRDADGIDSKSSRFRGGRPGVVCFNSPYRELAVAQVAALAKKYPLDGIFFDMLFNWIRVCYCGHCRRLYQEQAGADLPARDDRSSAAFRSYLEWRNQRLHDFTSDLITAFKTHRPDGVATFNSPRPHSGRPSNLDSALLADILSGDPSHGEWSSLPISFACNTWSNMTKGYPARMDIGRMRGNEGQHTGTRSVEELTISAAICMAHDLAIEFIDVVNADGTLYDSPFRDYKKVFDFMRPLEPYVGGDKIRSVGIYISDKTKDFLYEQEEYRFISIAGPSPAGSVDPYTSGLEEVFRAFQMHHVPVDLITRLRLDRLEDYDLVVVPDAMCMSEEEADRIRQYVSGGGNLLATRYTSLADWDGNKRHNFALADVLGVDYLGETENNETYIQVSPELCAEAGIPEDMEIKIDRQAIVAARPGTEALGRIVLPYTNRANDAQQWIGIWDSPPGLVTDHPAVVMNDYGDGRSCYLSAHVHARDSHYSVEEPRELMYTLARSMLADRIPLYVDGPPWLVVTGFRKPENGAIVVHLVNAPRDVPVLPLSDVTVTLRLREGEEVSSIAVHPGQRQIAFERDGDAITFTLPEVGLYQVIVADLA